MKKLVMFIVIFLEFTYADRVIKIVPGKSIGNISIGDERASLIDKGFKLEESRDSQDYLENQSFLVRLVKDKTVQIWYKPTSLAGLTLNGRKFPKKNDMSTLKKFFKSCEPEFTGSGGQIIYCENRGVEIVFSHSLKFEGLSIVGPGVAESVIGIPATRK